MPDLIVIEMTETVTTTVVVDRDWLARHNLPANLHTLASGDHDDELFEAIDALDLQDPVVAGAHQLQYDVTDRDFVAHAKEA